jgi:hypothetical protein
MKIIPFLTASLLVAGCAGTTPMFLGPDHPASLDAANAPVPPPSTTLSLSKSERPTTAPATTTDPAAPSHGRDHTAHTHHRATGGQPTPATNGPSAGITYVCPHHPEVVSDQPAKCPKCKMKLVRKEAGQ